MLKLGSRIGKWGFPSKVYNYDSKRYEDRGMIWHGKKPPSVADYEMLYKALGDDVEVDQGSVVGKSDPRWTTFHDQNNARAKKKFLFF